MHGATVLIIDDEESIRKTLTGVLADEGYEIATAASGQEGLDLLQEAQPSIVMLDISMEPGIDGIETLRRIKEMRPELPVIMITGHGDDRDRRSRRSRWALTISFRSRSRWSRYCSRSSTGWMIASCAKRTSRSERASNAATRSWARARRSRRLKHQISLAGPTNGWVLIHGESGTGKELVARAIHRASKRVSGPFVEVNCAAIPQELIESELFGHEKGSFTGATGLKRGKFELADKGTIFLDEIADMSLATQAKVLRVLEGQEFQRVGGTRTLKADVRVIAASNKDLAEEIKKGAFREDLFYRLNVIPLEVPPLRERTDDIPRLVRHFLQEFSREYGQKPKTVDDDALALFLRYPWPGNVRELRNIIERLIIMVARPDDHGL